MCIYRYDAMVLLAVESGENSTAAILVLTNAPLAGSSIKAARLSSALSPSSSPLVTPIPPLLDDEEDEDGCGDVVSDELVDAASGPPTLRQNKANSRLPPTLLLLLLLLMLLLLPHTQSRAHCSRRDNVASNQVTRGR